jgi:hypothetical protein
MKAPLPPEFKPPFWATKDFRRLLLGGVVGLAVLGVLVFDVGPMLNNRPSKAKKVDPNAFVPQPLAAGQTRELKFEGVLEKAKDGTSIDDQDEPYQYLVRCLARMDAAQLAKDAKPVDYSYYSKMPVEMRGQTVKIMALFLTSNPIRVDAAPGGVNFIHRTYLMDLRGDEGYVVDLLERPPDLNSRSLVGLDAVFLKLGTYEAKKGAVQAPLFLGRGLHVVNEPKMATDPMTKMSTGLILGVAGASMLVMLALTSRMFRKAKPPAPKGPALSLETLKS